MSTDDQALARFSDLDTCAVSDALDHLGAPGSTLGIHSMWGRPKVVGRARTISLREALPHEDNSRRHIAAASVESSGPGEVIVIENHGRVDVSCWGDILTAAAQARRIEGVVIDGACRDIDAIADARFPVYGRAAVMRTARGRLEERATDVPVVVAGVVVSAGDIVIADGSGVVFVPDEISDRVLSAAEGLARRQHKMRDSVENGASVVEAMRDRNFVQALSERP